ncbi:MAG: flagellar hook-associated protein FlgK [Anaerolineaceae bacterium]
MGNLFGSIQNAVSSMLSYQQVIEVIEHNVANASTKGYRRQEAILTPGVPTSTARAGGNYVGQMGTGVRVDYIRQYNLAFIDAQIRSQLAESSKWELSSNILSQIEATFDETGDDGLIPKLDAFWAGWQSLADDPANMSLRINLVQVSADLADAINNRVDTLNSIRQDQNNAILQSVDEINSIATQVAKLNTEITKAIGVNESPNDLIDERDRLLEQLAELTGGTVNIQENGEALVTIGGHALVVGSNAFELTTTRDSNNLVQISWEADGRDFIPNSGKLAGLFEVRDVTVPEQLTGLKELAETLTEEINEQHAEGYDLNGDEGDEFFVFSTSGDYYFNLKLSDNLDDPAHIAAASSEDSPGDGNNATIMAQLREALLMNGGASTFNSYYNSQITSFGLKVKEANTKSSDSSVVLSSLTEMRDSESGVSLDEEAGNLVSAQKSYQACARVLTAIDEMLEVLINGTGLVGR